MEISGHIKDHLNCGDFKFEYKLSDDGKFRLVTFRKLEEVIAPDVTNYTGGVGFYTGQFKILRIYGLGLNICFKKKTSSI